MIPVTSFAGKTVAVFGLGGSGLASCHALKAGGAEVIAGDDNADNVAKAAQAGFITADLRTASWANFAALVLTPGAPLTHPAPHWSVLAARQAGIEVIGDIELFCRERRRHAPDAPFVAITGTNGKSTTTALIAHLMKVAGYDTQMGGNIGTAILSLEPPRMGRVHVIEMSSYQIDLRPRSIPRSASSSISARTISIATARWNIMPRSRSAWSPACSRAAPRSSASMTAGAATSPTASNGPASAWCGSR